MSSVSVVISAQGYGSTYWTLIFATHGT